MGYYFTTNSAIYDSSTQKTTVPGALYSDHLRRKLFPLLNPQVFMRVEIKRGETIMVGGQRFPAPGAFVKIVPR